MIFMIIGILKHEFFNKRGLVHRSAEFLKYVHNLQIIKKSLGK